jgi:hypothetical protein
MMKKEEISKDIIEDYHLSRKLYTDTLKKYPLNKYILSILYNYMIEDYNKLTMYDKTIVKELPKFKYEHDHDDTFSIIILNEEEENKDDNKSTNDNDDDDTITNDIITDTTNEINLKKTFIGNERDFTIGMIDLQHEDLLDTTDNEISIIGKIMNSRLHTTMSNYCSIQ